MKNLFSVLFVSLLLLVSSSNLFSQVTTIPAGASPYANLNAAFTAINAGGPYTGVAVTVTITANLVEPAVAILNGGVFTSCLIRPAGPITVGGNFNTAVIRLNGADVVTIDGLNAGGNSLTIVNPNAGATANGVECINGATNNIIRNITAIGAGANGDLIGGRGINIGQSIAGSGGNDNNLIEGCTTNGFRRGIQNFGTAGATGFTNNNTTIRNCIIKNATQLGIFIGSESSGNTAEGNQIFNDAPTPTALEFRAIGIQGVGTSIVRRNRIHTLNSTVPATLVGIIAIPVLLTAPGSSASTITIVNNMVSLTENNVGSPDINGITLGFTNTPAPYQGNAYFNSVLISGTDAPTTASAGSAGLSITNSTVGSSMKVFNNLVLNTRSGGDSNSQHVGGLTFTAVGVSVSSDYNVYRATDAGNGFNAGWDGFLYNNINAYRQVASNPTINELHTVFSTTFAFVTAIDLHLVPGSVGGSINGTPISGITTDFDGDTRSTTTPYRGADELPIAFKNLNIFVALQGALPPNTDIVTMGLANASSPHSLVALATEIINGGTHTGTYYFGNAVANGVPYYLVAFHRNHVETWSSVTITFAGGVANYTFTSGLGQAFGNNQIMYAGLAAMYGGDVNQDGIVDGTDGAAADNDAFNFVSGNQILTDITDDGTVDGSDGAIIDNNASNFIGVIRPPSPNSVTEDPLRSNDLKSAVVQKKSIISKVQF